MIFQVLRFASCKMVTLLLQYLAFLASSSCLQQEIYPPVYNDDDNNHIYFGLMMSNRGEYDSYSVVPAIQVALDLINNDSSSLLKEAKLHYVLYDSQCDRQKTLDNFFSMILSPPANMVAVLGSGCSLATAASAELSHFYNITQISCVSNSFELSNKDRFKQYYQMLPSEYGVVQAFTSIIIHYNWKRIFIIAGNSYLNMSLHLKKRLKQKKIQVDIHLIQQNALNNITGNIFKPNYRIFVLLMDSDLANSVLCIAFSEKKMYPTHFFLIPYMHKYEWWMAVNNDMYNCSSADRAATLEHSLVVSPFPTQHTSINGGDSENLTSIELRRNSFMREYNTKIATSNYSYNEFAEYCFDAVWAIALTINNTGLYFASKEKEWHNGNSTLFEGLTGDVDFNEYGIRKAETYDMFQYRLNISEKYSLENYIVAHMSCANDTVECSLFYINDYNDSNIWKYGVPYDGVEVEEIITTNVILSTLFVIICFLGIIFAVVCFIFNLVYKSKKLIRLTSPKINYIICIGSIMVYFGIMVKFIMPTTNPLVAQLLCGIYAITSVNGYVLTFLCILAKLGRIYFIFRSARKKITIKDKHLLTFILLTFSIPVALTLLWIILKVFFFSVTPVSYAERPQSKTGVFDIVTNYSYYQCSWTIIDTIIATLGGLNLLTLKLVALFLCFRIRKIKIKGLNESKYVTAIVYFSSIFVIINLVLVLSIAKYFTVLQILTGSIDLINVTGILAVSFVPKMVSLYRDPDGDGIFQPSVTNAISTLHGQRSTPIDVLNDRSSTKGENANISTLY